MPWSIIKESLVNQARENPALVFLILVLSISVSLAFFSYAYRVFAEKHTVNEQFQEVAAVSEKIKEEIRDVSADVSRLSNQTKELDRNTQIRALEAVIRALDAEMFELEELIRSGAATEKQRIRYAQLRSDKADQERRLGWLTR